MTITEINNLTTKEIEKLRDEEWAHKPGRDQLMQGVCAEMRSTPPEEYRKYLLVRYKANKEERLRV